MKIKSIYLIAACIYVIPIIADFAPSFSYVVRVQDANAWGIGNAQAISNNLGKKGTLRGKGSSLGVCPCLAHGVKAWTASTTIPYNYSDKDVQDAQKNQQQASGTYQKPCTVVQPGSGQKVAMAPMLEEAHDFIANIDTLLSTVLNLFPDVTQGQGYESTVLLNFCTTPTTLLERINSSNTQFFDWAHFENYFENNEFTLFLDLQELVPSSAVIAQGSAFATAVIQHYCALLKKFSVSSDIVQKEKAIKDALLW